MRHQGRTTYDCDLCGKKDCGWILDRGEMRNTAKVEYTMGHTVDLCESCNFFISANWGKVVVFMKSLVNPKL